MPHAPPLPDDDDTFPAETSASSLSPWAVFEGMAFAAALLGAGLFLQVLLG